MMNTQEIFSSHLIPSNPLIASATCRRVNNAYTTGRLLTPNRMFIQLLMAPAPTQLWNPNHTIAGSPLKTPGILTPVVPKLLLNCTVNGIP